MRCAPSSGRRPRLHEIGIGAHPTAALSWIYEMYVGGDQGRWLKWSENDWKHNTSRLKSLHFISFGVYNWNERNSGESKKGDSDIGKWWRCPSQSVGYYTLVGTILFGTNTSPGNAWLKQNSRRFLQILPIFPGASYFFLGPVQAESSLKSNSFFLFELQSRRKLVRGQHLRPFTRRIIMAWNAKKAFWPFRWRF
jgi:hypothetical protein